MTNVLVSGGRTVAIGAAAASIALVAALQLHHSFRWRAGQPPRGWRWTLAVQTLLPFAWFPAYDWNVLTLAGPAAGSALLLLPRRWAWTAAAAILAGVAVAWSLPVLDLYYGAGNRAVYVVATDNATVLYQLGAAATGAIVVYGLSRLPDLAEQVAAARRELARAAVERERQRVAQDTHDLLGLGLSAVALKSDLAGRLVGRDEDRARAELDALLRLTARARADIRAVTTGEGDLSVSAELAAARDVLASAGVATELRGTAAGAALPPPVDGVLATVLREGVTNVLRHSAATRCVIELTTDGGSVGLRVRNDGVRANPPEPTGRQRPGGNGLPNLSARVAALGGRLTTHADGGHFELAATVPLADASDVRRGEDPPAAGDRAHSLDEVVGGTVLDQEP
ncbi:sensor histidine kinase [Jiangella aurantiaca]